MYVYIARMSTRKKANVASTDGPKPKRGRRPTPAAAAIVDVSMRDVVCQQEAVGQLGVQATAGEQAAVDVAEANMALSGCQGNEVVLFFWRGGKGSFTLLI